MKLRLTSKQLRFRLTEQEAQQLLQDELLRESLPLPAGQKLDYLIQLSKHDQPMNLLYHDHALILVLSQNELHNLIEKPSKEGLQASYTIENKNIIFSVEIELPTSMCSH